MGGVAGAFVGLMVSPKSGEALRKDIQTRAVNIADHVQDCTVQQAETIKEKSTNLLEKGKKIKEDLNVLWQDIKPRKLGYKNVVQSSLEEIIESEVENESPSEPLTETPSSETSFPETPAQDDIETLL